MTLISIFKIPESKSGMAEHKNGKKSTKIYFFSFMKLCSKSSSCNRIPQLFLYLHSFLIASAIIIATHGQNITLTVKSSYTLWYVQL